MSLFNNLPSIPSFRPAFNIGGGLDIPCGAYHIGKHGESILNGGLSNIVSLAGPGNSFKTVIMLFINLSVANRINQYKVSLYDTESSLSYDRVNQLSERFANLCDIDHGSDFLSPDELRILITSSADILGDVYFDEILKIASEKRKSKAPLLETPFFTPAGKPISLLPPTGSMIDSLSEFKVTANETNIVDKNSLGESGNNILYMRQGIAKKQLITQLPNMCVNSGLYFTMTAHIGDEFDIGGMMAPKKHKLTHAKKGSKITGTTKAFEFINNALYEIFDCGLLNNKEYQTGVLYPVIESDRAPDCTDLLKIHLKLTRNKSGPSGACIDLIVSQREGVLAHLSQFHYIKEEDRFGLVGNNTSYALALVPDIKLSRTTVRGKIDEFPEVRRALEIISELLQIKTLWAELPDNLMCTPEELYNDIKALGYDWNVLLNTRGYWVFNESENDELPYLSTMDLLKVRKGLYTPYFLNPDYIKKSKGFLNETLTKVVGMRQ